MFHFDHLPVPDIHMYAAGQTGIEAANRAHDIDALEILWAIVFENGCVLHRVLIRAGSSIHIARIRVPWCRRVRMVIRDLAFADDHMMREHPTHRLVEPAADGLLGNLEVTPGGSAAGVQLPEC